MLPRALQPKVLGASLCRLPANSACDASCRFSNRQWSIGSSQDYQHVVIVALLLQLLLVQHSRYDSDLERSANCEASRHAHGNQRRQHCLELGTSRSSRSISLRQADADEIRKSHDVYVWFALGCCPLLFCAAAHPILADAGSLPQPGQSPAIKSSGNCTAARLLTLPVLGLAHATKVY